MNIRNAFVCFFLLLAGFLLSAEGTYMYVDSPEGLRVRDQASLSANRISGLTHQQMVKVIQTGDAATIDGIDSNWMKIELPSTSWTSDEPLSGWVFGGYLSSTRDEALTSDISAVYEPAVKNTAAILLTENPSYAPVQRKDFALSAGDSMNRYAVATSFGKKVFVKQGSSYTWFDNLPPYTTISVEDSADPLYYRITWCNTQCFIRKTDVVRGAIAGFTLRETEILSSASTGSRTGRTCAARQLIAVTDISDAAYARTTEGWVSKDDIWTNQTDVGILQAFQHDLEVFAMEDDDPLKKDLLYAMLQKSTGYKETNLFWLEREAFARVWANIRELSKYNDEGYPADPSLTDLVAAATAFEKYFADTVNCCLPSVIAYRPTYTNFVPAYTFYIPSCGNYLKGSYAASTVAVTVDSYRIAFWYDFGTRSIIPLKPYYFSQGSGKLALNLTLAKRAQDAKTDEECEEYLAMLDDPTVKENLGFVGTDRTDRIQPLAVQYCLPRTTSDVFHTKTTIEVRNNPGTRFKVTGYLDAGTSCKASQMTCFWVKGYGDSTPYYEWLYVDSGSMKGWVRASELYDVNDRKVGADYFEADFSSVGYSGPYRTDVNCIAYSYDGGSVPLYGSLKGDSKEDIMPAFTESRASKPVAYIPNKSEVRATWYISMYEGDDNEAWSVGTNLYYVETSDGVRGWLAPENCVLESEDVPDHMNPYDAWLESLK